MIARELPATTAEEVARVVRALGSHRYVAGRMHLVHAFVFEAIADAGTDDAIDACAWAKATLEDRAIDRASRDERLWRRATEKELAAALGVLWATGDAGERARKVLADLLRAIDVVATGEHAFEEDREDDVFPVLVDAGWELLPLAALDPERHAGAIRAFGEPIELEGAKFDESSAIEPRPYLQELPILGPDELLFGLMKDGALLEPLVLWTEGPDAYHDYVLRGVASVVSKAR